MRNIKDIKSIIIKVGSTSLCDEEGHIDRERVLKIISQIAELKRSGYQVALVSSGAIAAGVGSLGLSESSKQCPTETGFGRHRSGRIDGHL